jgi:hypothetical protein
VIERDPGGFAHLSPDFRFAAQHGIKASRNAKQMVHRTAIAVAIKRIIQLGRRQLVKRREEQLDRSDAIRRQFAGNTVQFTAIESGKHPASFQNAARTKLVGGRTSLWTLNATRRAARPWPWGDQSDENDFLQLTPT